MAGNGIAMDGNSNPVDWARLRRPEAALQQRFDGGWGQRLHWAGPWRPDWALGMDAGLARSGAATELQWRGGFALEARPGLALAAALDALDRDDGHSAGAALSVDAGLRWQLPWAGFRLALGSRETPLLGDPARLLRESRAGLGWDGDALALSAELFSREGALMGLRGGLALRARPGLRLRGGLSTPALEGGAPMAGLGTDAEWGSARLALGAGWRIDNGHGDVRLDLTWSYGPFAEDARPKARVKTAPPPEAPPEPEGSFELELQMQERRPALRWPAQAEDGAYEVWVGLLPGANMRRSTAKPLTQPFWQGPPCLPGLTYYYQVRVLGTGGQELRRSLVRPVGAEEVQP